MIAWIILASITYLVVAAGTTCIFMNETKCSIPKGIYMGATWPLQLFLVLVVEAFKGLGLRPRKRFGKEWTGSEQELWHRKFPICLKRCNEGWQFKIGRHTTETVKSIAYYHRIDYCKDAAIDAYQNWEIEQSKKVAQS